jgi:acyl dehydratase
MIMSATRLLGSKITAGDRLPTFEVAVTAKTVVMGASSSRDWQPQHHDHEWAVKRAGTRDIFLNTPNQAGWIERYLTDWTGPHGRLGRLAFRMRTPVCPGDTLAFNGRVRDVRSDDAGCTWVDVDLDLTVNEKTVTECSARVALPSDPGDNPWRRGPDQWRP